MTVQEQAIRTTGAWAALAALIALLTGGTSLAMLGASAASSVAESAGKSRLGAAQKAWFKQEVIAARDAGFPLILWVSTVPWIATAALGNDTWAGYSTERTELANFFGRGGITRF